MKINSIIYIFFNYIIAVSILIFSILNKFSLGRYLTDTLFILICANIIYISVNIMINSLKVEEKSTFEMEIAVDDEELKELLREDEINESMNNIDNSYDFSEYNDMNEHFEERNSQDF